MAMEVSFSHALLLASLLLLLYLLCYRGKNSSSNGNIPSPPALPVLGHLHLLKKPLHRSLAALAVRHGGGRGGAGLLLLRFGTRPVLLVSSPAIAEECFTVHDVALADRPGLASRRLLSGDECPSIAGASYGPAWRHLRRIANVHALSAHRLSLTTSARDAEARAMARKLWRATRLGAAAVSVKLTAYEYVANVIMAMVAGRRMAEDEVLRFKAMTEAGFAAAGAANRHDFLPLLRLLDFGRTRRRLAGLAKERYEFGQSLVDEYRRIHHRHDAGGAATEDTTSTPAQRTVIGDLLRQQEGSPELYADVVIRTICLSLLQAGTDTSSSTIEWAMALLLNNPLVLVKAKEEIDVIVGTSRLLEERDLSCLPYLHGIITETLRMYPIAPHLAPHQASSDCVVAGGRYIITCGTMMLVDVYSMQRDPTLWSDPDMFMPERFEVDNDIAEDGDKQMVRIMPFGMGRRKCPGEGLAWRTVGVALGVMLQCFRWERMGKEEVDMREGSGFTMPMAMPLMAICQPHEEMNEILERI
ncbi:cytochrome P450 81Q32-like [Hordeum vulgare subsp. vulgare]|uniref:cytochrome P450 81Q32-like n=1 Tax=Hordeum vulgare subsp. vulgare TaxID=112509 RepID=UPI00029575F5|nr:cytochrome P450 81Q32-like [Hordeum vulgare subsp. vulgare]